MEFEYREEFIRSSRGVELFTCRWLPLSSPRALVFLCHGYGMECSVFMRAQDGYINKRRFLYGESMGGAVALLVHKKDPTFWHGAVLVAPMCKISEKVMPPQLVIDALTMIEDVIPKWKIVPTKDVIDSAFKDPIKREDVRKNKLIYQQKPRLKTALEMLRTSMNLEKSLNEVTLPFYVLHGEADTVTDPEVSKGLYEKASSKDKTIKLYPGMWHALTAGEPDENIEMVFNDIFAWLNKRTSDDYNGEPSTLDHEETPISEFALAMPSGSLHGRQRQQQRGGRSYGNYLCGLKGKSMQRHSSM